MIVESNTVQVTRAHTRSRNSSELKGRGDELNVIYFKHIKVKYEGCAQGWCDRFDQYGIKVGFGGCGALRPSKSCILSSKITPRNGFFGFVFLSPLGGWGIN